MEHKTNLETGQQAETTTNNSESLNFLLRIYSVGPWCLTAIIPDGRTNTRTFLPGDEQELVDFIRRHDGHQNLYYSVNQAKTALTKKAEKTDSALVHFLHAD